MKVKVIGVSRGILENNAMNNSYHYNDNSAQVLTKLNSQIQHLEYNIILTHYFRNANTTVIFVIKQNEKIIQSCEKDKIQNRWIISLDLNVN